MAVAVVAFVAVVALVVLVALVALEALVALMALVAAPAESSSSLARSFADFLVVSDLASVSCLRYIYRLPDFAPNVCVLAQCAVGMSKLHPSLRLLN